MGKLGILFILAMAASGFVAMGQGTDPLPEGISEDEISDELLAQGKELFNQDACVLCHGADGTGSDMAPDLTDDEWLHSQGDLDGIRRTVWYGVSKEQFKDKSRPYEMNPGGGLDLDRDTLNAVAAYAWSLSHKE